MIIKQLKRLGCSCDWDRERFTMDEGLSKAVREVFVRLYEEGLIYKGDYIVNWCPRCHTALSDLEVEHEQVAGTSLAHPVSGGRFGWVSGRGHHPARNHARGYCRSGQPEDERYTHLIGKYAILPLVGRRLKIIADRGGR